MQAIQEPSQSLADQAVQAPTAASALAQTQTLEEYAAALALRVAVPAGILAGLVVLLLNLSRNPVPFIDDPRGFGTIFFYFTLAIALFGGAWAYFMGTRFQNTRLPAEYQRAWWFGVLPIAIAYLAVAALAVGLLLQVANAAFKELELARLQGVFIAALMTAAVANWIISDAIQVNLRKLLSLIVITMSVGLYYAMASNENPYWWRVSFSFLGTNDSNVEAREQFNLTLLFGGFMLLVMQQFLMKHIRVLHKHDAMGNRSFRFFQISLVLLGILAALVGLFPSRVSDFYSIIHNLSAYSLAGILIAYMALIRWLIPKFSKDFINTSLVMTLVMVGVLVLAALKYFNTVGLEIMAFAIGGMWLSIFVKNIEMLAKSLEPEAYAE